MHGPYPPAAPRYGFHSCPICQSQKRMPPLRTFMMASPVCDEALSKRALPNALSHSLQSLSAPAAILQRLLQSLPSDSQDPMDPSLPFQHLRVDPSPHREQGKAAV